MNQSFLTKLLLVFVCINTIAITILGYKVNKLDNPEYEAKSLISLPDNFDFAYARLKAFNPSIDTATVIKITATANKFALSNKLETFKWGIGQLLLESGGSQYYREGTPKAGDLIVSVGGAIGIAQILPSTAFGYLTTRAKEEDKKILKELGCTDISFLFNKKLNRKTKIAQVKEWLKNETNNIAIWGFIMKNNLEKRSNVMTALATYNMGDGGLKTYLDSGQTVQNSDYVIAVKQKVDFVEGKLN